jgi:hypothetical protein
MFDTSVTFSNLGMVRKLSKVDGMDGMYAHGISITVGLEAELMQCT